MISKKKSISKNITRRNKLINSTMDLTNFRKYKIQFACGKCKQKSDIKYKLNKLNSNYIKNISCSKCNSKLINHKIKIKQLGSGIISKIPIVASGFVGLISLFIYLKEKMGFSLDKIINDISELFNSNNDNDNDNNSTYIRPTLISSNILTEYEPIENIIPLSRVKEIKNSKKNQYYNPISRKRKVYLSNVRSWKSLLG